MKHKWHKEIKAWADGAEIEYSYYTENGVCIWNVVDDPKWSTDEADKYRIKPHKHQAIIDAFEQGAVIEAQLITGTWCEVITPDWESNYKFRIKPQPKEPQDVSSTSYLYVFCDHKGEQVLRTHTGQNKQDTYIGKIKLEEE
jgi:hypothetical protein